MKAARSAPVTRIVSDRDLLQAVREEIRLAGLVSEPVPALPLPVDAGAEREVISALVCEQVRPVDLGDLEARHFGVQLHAWTFAKVRDIHNAGLQLSTDLLIVAAMEDGISPDGYARELDDLRWEAFRTHATLMRHVAHIIELWRRRELCMLLAAVDLRLRTGALDYERAMSLLGKGPKK